MHVLRCFENGEIIHVNDSVDPVRDLAVVETELMLADLQSLEKRKVSLVKKLRGGSDPDMQMRMGLIERCEAALEEGIHLTAVPWTPTEWSELLAMQLLSTKPIAYVCNVDEDSAGTGNAHSRAVEEYVKAYNAALVEKHGEAAVRVEEVITGGDDTAIGKAKKASPAAGKKPAATANEAPSCARGLRKVSAATL